jgi:hypothetical protein
MTTIRLPADGELPPSAAHHLTEIRRTELERFGIPTLSNIWRCMAHSPALIEATWRKSKAVRAPGRLDALTRECIASAVSIANNCRY